MSHERRVARRDRAGVRAVRSRRRRTARERRRGAARADGAARARRRPP